MALLHNSHLHNIQKLSKQHTTIHKSHIFSSIFMIHKKKKGKKKKKKKKKNFGLEIKKKKNKKCPNKKPPLKNFISFQGFSLFTKKKKEKKKRSK